ncbi:MAG: hypothetical protein ONB12_05795 [candidate division KSB1 bacterium]|nr:hypothetical protein [candidate division KSB1 bacterium]
MPAKATLPSIGFEKKPVSNPPIQRAELSKAKALRLRAAKSFFENFGIHAILIFAARFD